MRLGGAEVGGVKYGLESQVMPPIEVQLTRTGKSINRLQLQIGWPASRSVSLQCPVRQQKL